MIGRALQGHNLAQWRVIIQHNVRLRPIKEERLKWAPAFVHHSFASSQKELKEMAPYWEKIY